MDSQNVKNNSGVAKDIEDNKVIAILAYLVFFLPLLAAKNSRFAMYHGNQGFLLFLLLLAVNTVGTVVPILGWLIILPIGNLLILVLLIMGIINASKGEEKSLPIIGKYTIIKPPESH